MLKHAYKKLLLSKIISNKRFSQIKLIEEAITMMDKKKIENCITNSLNELSR
jgi:hypothetical protein